jgi:hypothetical protein
MDKQKKTRRTPMANRKQLSNLVIENAKIIFRNFAGLEGTFNRAGDRNFCLVLDQPGLAETMIADGWNVKFLKPREEGDEPLPYLPVAVSYKYANKAPQVYMISSRGRTAIPEDLVGMMDLAEIANVDVTVNPSFWEVNNNSGVKAYLKKMYLTIVEDALDLKYANVPDSAQNALEAAAEPLQITAGDDMYVEFEER